MQNMVVLIDTNVLLNYLTNRDDDYLKQSIRIVEMCAKGECIGYIAFHTLFLILKIVCRISVPKKSGRTISLPAIQRILKIRKSLR